MKHIRFTALQTATSRPRKIQTTPDDRIPEYYGDNVFNDAAMHKFMSSEAYKHVQAAIKGGKKIDHTIADQVAAGMKAWAIANGVTSYTHWFQPLTGLTAEKHDTFFTLSNEGAPIEKFNGESLVQQEPDASSFPNGGIRQTFEARGYTAWDPSSPAFIMESNGGKNLCIPTIFISYTGEALDFKAPLLKSINALENAALPVVNLFDRHATKVTTTLGWEQEYFLVDEAMYYARPDLLLSGRTLIGHMPAKGQQLEDHYFGSIPDRVYAFMTDFEHESHKLGIPVRTRHNEVAPSQFECAPMFEEVNVAVDHNTLLMDVMEKVAKRHQLKVLFHEKPFAGVNGSGKHNNWSMSTDTGKNLLSPGKTPRTNLLFLTFFVNVIKAVHTHANLIRVSIASASNDHRLGANEAPPAIISVFIGEHLRGVLEEIEKRVGSGKSSDKATEELKLDIHNKIPDLMLDNTDRNRTSPFAFTGNKFEIRAVGSSANCAFPMTVMNTIMANQLIEFKKEVDVLVKKGEEKETAVLKVLRKYISESKNILFEGDNYSEEWAKEAKRRGLANVKTTPHAIEFFKEKTVADLFIRNGIFNQREIDARYEVMHHSYTLRLQIEGRILGDLAVNQVIPAAIEYQNRLIANAKGLKEIGAKKEHIQSVVELITDISESIRAIKTNVDQMIEERKKANNLKQEHQKSKAYCDKVKPLFDVIRLHCDKLEQLVEDDYWPLPKYREMLFIK